MSFSASLLLGGITPFNFSYLWPKKYLMIRYTKDTDYIATLTLDMQGHSINILNHQIAEAFLPVVELLKAEKSKGRLRGVIIQSAKKNFLEGGQWEYLYRSVSAADLFRLSEKMKALFREIEYPGVPVAAIIEGSALGAGLELALACHRRYLVNRPGVKIGFPEIQYGIMPGNGGVIRLLWLLGIEKAFEFFSENPVVLPEPALRFGLVDELTSDSKEALTRARQWLLETSEGRRPWDIRGACIPGGTAKDPLTARKIARLAASCSQELPSPYLTHKKNAFSVLQAILYTLSEGSVTDFDTACRIESRYQTALLIGQNFRNRAGVLLFDQRKITAGLSRPKGFGRFRPVKTGIIGAGLMGSGIAAACLVHGQEVVLKDVSRMIAEQGKDRLASILKHYQHQGVLDAANARQILQKVKTTESAADFADCDLVIESVFENEAVKKKVIQETDYYLDEYAFLASNTASIPIGQLGAFSCRQEKFVGLHFFKPVETSSLVEIVRSTHTDDETVARAFDFVQSIGKVPIVVKDSWGFYVSRVQNTYILEGVTMLQEGIPPALIENLGRQAGMQRGPLELADELSMDLVLRYENQAALLYGKKYVQHPAVVVLKKMKDELQRPGATKNNGFYEYVPEKHLWPGLNALFTAKIPEDGSDASPTRAFTSNHSHFYQSLIERFLFAQALEATWCLQEGVIATVKEANVGSILGWGFPPDSGGVIRYIEQYGKEKFIARCQKLTMEHGQRFKVPQWIKQNLTTSA